MKIPAPHIKRTVKFQLQGHTVTMHIWAYREIDDLFVRHTIADFARMYRRKKLKQDIIVKVPTIYGIADPI